MSEQREPYITGGEEEPIFNLGMLTFTCKASGKVRVDIIPGKKWISLSRDQARALGEFLLCTEPDEEAMSEMVETSEEGEELHGAPATFLEIEGKRT